MAVLPEAGLAADGPEPLDPAPVGLLEGLDCGFGLSATDVILEAEILHRFLFLHRNNLGPKQFSSYHND